MFCLAGTASVVVVVVVVVTATGVWGAEAGTAYTTWMCGLLINSLSGNGA